MHKQLVKRQSLTMLMLLYVALLLQAQIPVNYYSSAKGQKGKSLKTALYQKIASHTALSYKALWEAYKKTDVRADGKIWDMYSNVTNYAPGGSAQGANYKGEGDSYNREHSFPKSWFNDETPMYTDLFHLYPTDGYVNNRRSNYPFGETNGETYTSANGFSKLGTCTVPGYKGVVFEPNDEYKGDFARTYFYMATAYEDKIAGWHSDMLAGNAYPAYKEWVITMLLRWAQEDPVSQKEIDRNNAVYKIQGNRNPYIDYPGLEQYVWGSKTSTAFDPDNYDNSGTVDPTPDPKPTTVVAPTFSPASGVVAKGTNVTISTTTEGATIYYSVNQGDIQTAYMTTQVDINANTTITAYAMLGQNKSEEVTVTYTLQPDAPMGENVYTLVTDNASLTAGKQLLIVGNLKGKNVAMSNQRSDIRSYANVEVTDNAIETEVGGADQPYAFILGGSNQQWTLYDQVANVYLCLSSDANKLQSTDKANTEDALWDITIANDGTAKIRSNKFDDRYINFNSSSPRFATYKSTSKQQPVSIYAQATSTAIATIKIDSQGAFSVYNTQGQLVRRAQTINAALQQLPAGLYIINGKKVLIK